MARRRPDRRTGHRSPRPPAPAPAVHPRVCRPGRRPRGPTRQARGSEGGRSMNLLTPILLKHPGDPLCPSDDSTYYLLTSKGLFVCRNEQFYRSSVPARNWPAELADHASFLEPRFPRIPEAEFAQIVGFFRAVAERHHAEAAVLLAWNRTTRRVVVVVPPQEAGSMRVTYQTASVADPDLVFFGDVHSHVDGPAFASYVDAEDELNRPGLHLVVGRVRRLEPEVYVAAVVDGLRFELELADARSEEHTSELQSLRHLVC